MTSMQANIPPDFWAELKRQKLIEQNAPTPGRDSRIAFVGPSEFLKASCWPLSGELHGLRRRARETCGGIALRREAAARLYQPLAQIGARAFENQ